MEKNNADLIKVFKIVNGELLRYMGRKREAVIPESVYSVRPGIFNRSGVERVVLPKTVSGIGISMFDGCASLKEVVLPMGIRHISMLAFRGCAIEEIDIPDTVEFIGGDAFAGCPIKRVSVPEGCVLGQDSDAFPAGCAVTTRPVDRSPKPSDFEIRGDLLLSYRGLSPVAVLPEGVVRVGRQAFAYWNGLKKVDLSHVREIGERAFWGCGGLSEVTFGEGLIRIGDDSFEGCGSLKRVHIPSTVEEIGARAFLCSSIEEAEIPARCEVGEEAFPEGCKIVRRADQTEGKGDI